MAGLPRPHRFLSEGPRSRPPALVPGEPFRPGVQPSDTAGAPRRGHAGEKHPRHAAIGGRLREGLRGRLRSFHAHFGVDTGRRIAPDRRSPVPKGLEVGRNATARQERRGAFPPSLRLATKRPGSLLATARSALFRTAPREDRVAPETVEFSTLLCYDSIRPCVRVVRTGRDTAEWECQYREPTSPAEQTRTRRNGCPVRAGRRHGGPDSGTHG